MPKHPCADCHPNSRMGLLRISIPSILFIAAIAKAYQLATDSGVNIPSKSNWWLRLIEIEFELLLGAWLLLRPFKLLSWAVAVISFGVFFAWSGYKTATGSPECGCFGAISPNPRYTVAFDATILLALIWFRPIAMKTQDSLANQPKPERVAPSFCLISATWLSIGIPVVLATSRFSTRESAHLFEHSQGNRPIVVEPANWVGKPFPLIEYTNVARQLRTGSWLLLLHHEHCSKCATAISHYTQLAAATKGQAQQQLALIQVPQYHSTPKALKTDGTFVSGYISSDHNWFIQTPLFVHLSESKVVKIGETTHAE